MGRQRLGILGGTFDPIHNGHLMIARAMLDKLGLDRILFIPDYIPPHKRGWHCSPSADRLAMTIQAAAEDPRYTASPMELDRGGVSYTCDTLRQLYRKWHRFYDLYFIIGAESAEQLPTWHHIREAMTSATFAAAARPGFAPHKEKVSEELARQGLKVCLADLDLQFGDVCYYLKLNPERTIADAQKSMEQHPKDTVAVEYLTRYQEGNTGFDVLANPKLLEEAYNMDNNIIKSLVLQLQLEYDYVILDTTSTFSALNLLLMDMSTLFNFVGIVDFIPTIKNMMRGSDTLK